MTTPCAQQHEVKLYHEWHRELTEKYPNLRSDVMTTTSAGIRVVPTSRGVRIACVEFYAYAPPGGEGGVGDSPWRRGSFWKLYDIAPTQTAATK